MGSLNRICPDSPLCGNPNLVRSASSPPCAAPRPLSGLSISFRGLDVGRRYGGARRRRAQVLGFWRVLPQAADRQGHNGRTRLELLRLEEATTNKDVATVLIPRLGGPRFAAMPERDGDTSVRSHASEAHSRACSSSLRDCNYYFDGHYQVGGHSRQSCLRAGLSLHCVDSRVAAFQKQTLSHFPGFCML